MSALLNKPLSTTVAAISDAVIGPTPGIVARQRAVSYPCVRDNLRASNAYDTFSQCAALVEQSREHLACLLGKALSASDQRQEYQVPIPFWDGQAKFRRQAAHGEQDHAV